MHSRYSRFRADRRHVPDVGLAAPYIRSCCGAFKDAKPRHPAPRCRCSGDARCVREMPRAPRSRPKVIEDGTGMEYRRSSFEYEDLLSCGRGELFVEGTTVAAAADADV